MSRRNDSNRPWFLLWVLAALCMHVLFGWGGQRWAVWQEKRAALRSLSGVLPTDLVDKNYPFDVDLSEPVASLSQSPVSPVPPLTRQSPLEKKPMETKPDVSPNPVPTPPLPDGRIAVRQQAAPNQPDNPTAHFLAEEANRVEEETVARHTSPSASMSAAEPADEEKKAPSVEPPPSSAPPSPRWSFSPLHADHPSLQTEGGARHRMRTDSSPQQQQGFGFGKATAPGHANPNLSYQGMVSVVGEEVFERLRQEEGERRRDQHRGQWVSSSLAHWRAALEQYVSSVKPGNQTSLGTAASPFATYLHSMHLQIHAFFAESFLPSLADLPRKHPMNTLDLQTHLELVLSAQGEILRMGVVHTSGVTAFDLAALDAVQRASPFDAAPAAILSPDGSVYLHWEFHRDETYACSTRNAHPFVLRTLPRVPNSVP